MSALKGNESITYSIHKGTQLNSCFRSNLLLLPPRRFLRACYESPSCFVRSLSLSLSLSSTFWLGPLLPMYVWTYMYKDCVPAQSPLDSIARILYTTTSQRSGKLYFDASSFFVYSFFFFLFDWHGWTKQKCTRLVWLPPSTSYHFARNWFRTIVCRYRAYTVLLQYLIDSRKKDLFCAAIAEEGKQLAESFPECTAYVLVHACKLLNSPNTTVLNTIVKQVSLHPIIRIASFSSLEIKEPLPFSNQWLNSLYSSLPFSMHQTYSSCEASLSCLVGQWLLTALGIELGFPINNACLLTSAYNHHVRVPQAAFSSFCLPGWPIPSPLSSTSIRRLTFMQSLSGCESGGNSF